MATRNGWPIWYELMTDDPAGAAAFYGAVAGWEIDAEGNPMPTGAEYRAIGRSDGGMEGGVLTITADMAAHGAQPVWVAYFCVEDVDAKVAQANELGGKLHMPPMTIDGIGRMAMLTDPQGALFYLMTPTPPPGQPDAQSDVFAFSEVGRCAWNELNTSDAPGAIAFYSDLFGWTFENGMEMPGDNLYRFIETGDGGIGAISSMMAQGYSPAWLPYFRVGDIAAAQAAAEANGGKVVNGPHEVPGGDTIIVTRDPAGAWVGFVANKGG